MKINIIHTNTELRDAVVERINKKVGKLERYFKKGTQIDVTVITERKTKNIEVAVPYYGIIIRAEAGSEDYFTSIDLVLEKLERQIHKQKTKLLKRIKPGAFSYNKPLFSEGEDFEEEKKDIVKIKRFDVKPMSYEEAMMQIELLGHNFFVFLNEETNNVNVLYHRKDGNYGLLQPDY